MVRKLGVPKLMEVGSAEIDTSWWSSYKGDEVISDERDQKMLVIIKNSYDEFWERYKSSWFIWEAELLESDELCENHLSQLPNSICILRDADRRPWGMKIN